MTEKEYRAHPAISKSSLFKLTESPEKFKWYMEHPQPPTPALLFGQLFHKMALQPEDVWKEFAVAPNVDRRTKQGKQEYEAFLKESEGMTVVQWDMVEKAKEMCDALMANQFAVKLLAGEKETPYFWTDSLTGEQCKCRTDCLTTIGNMTVIVDLKTTQDGRTDNFMRDAIKHGYDLQAAMYSEGVKANIGKDVGFVFIAIEKEPPYSINILQADPIFIRRGADLFRELIGMYHDCKVNDTWFGYLGKFSVINNLSLPAWLAREVD